MSKEQLKYICGVKDTEKIGAVTGELVAYMAEAEQQFLFLKRQADAINERRNDIWKRLKQTLIEEGKLDKDLDFTEWVLEFSEDRSQLFRYKKGSDMPDFIRRLIES